MVLHKNFFKSKCSHSKKLPTCGQGLNVNNFLNLLMSTTLITFRVIFYRQAWSGKFGSFGSFLGAILGLFLFIFFVFSFEDNWQIKNRINDLQISFKLQISDTRCIKNCVRTQPMSAAVNWRCVV